MTPLPVGISSITPQPAAEIRCSTPSAPSQYRVVMQTKSQRLWQCPCLFCRAAQVHGSDESINSVKHPARYGRRGCLCLSPSVAQLDEGSCFAVTFNERPLETFTGVGASFTAVLYCQGVVVAIRCVVPLVALRLEIASDGKLENVAVTKRTRILENLSVLIASNLSS